MKTGESSEETVNFGELHTHSHTHIPKANVYNCIAIGVCGFMDESLHASSHKH